MRAKFVGGIWTPIIFLLIYALSLALLPEYLLAQGRDRGILPERKMGDRLGLGAMPDGSNRHTVVIDGVERSYYVYTPRLYSKERSYPIIMAFHGGGGNAANILKMTGLTQYIDEYEFILIVPNGSSRFGKESLMTWNAGNCCGYAMDAKSDDVEFVSAIIHRTSRNYGIDRSRVFLTGMSNGGMISYKLACELSESIAGIASVVGPMNYEPCKPKRPVPVVMFYGTADEHVLYKGGSPVKSADKRHPRVDKPVSHAVDFWVKNNKCDPTPSRKRTGNIITDTYTKCVNNANVTLYTVVDGGHAWPGGNKGTPWGDVPTQELKATPVILEFFLRR